MPVTPGWNGPRRPAGWREERAAQELLAPGVLARGFIHITPEQRAVPGGVEDLGVPGRDWENDLSPSDVEKQAYTLLNTANVGGYFEAFRGAPYENATAQKIQRHALALLGEEFNVDVYVQIRADGSVRFDVYEQHYKKRRK